MSRRGLLSAAIFVIVCGVVFLALSTDDPDLSMDGPGVQITRAE